MLGQIDSCVPTFYAIVAFGLLHSIDPLFTISFDVGNRLEIVQSQQGPPTRSATYPAKAN